MTDDFKIVVEWLEGSVPHPIERSTFATIVINTAGQDLTELEDLFAQTVRPGPRVSAYDLALWLADNWWRLRWEPWHRSVDWKLSHVIAAAGGGFAWPDISIESDGVHVLFEARKTSDARGSPVRYIGDADVQISADAFETGVDEFIERVLARLSSTGVGETDLSLLWQHVISERSDSQLRACRRLEAMLGFDPGEAPEELMISLSGMSSEAGPDALDEVAAAAKADAPETLRDTLERTRASENAIRVEFASEILRQFSDQASSTELPWQRAKRAARLARDVWGIDPGPIANNVLSDVLSVRRDFLEYTAANGLPIAAGLRTNVATETVNIIMRAKVETGRRFEIMRLVADHIVASAEDRLLPATKAKTDRQKFQRAFSQEFLLPFDELYHRLDQPRRGENEISDDDIDDVAREYIVSPLMVRTVLVNQGFLPREVLPATV
jgi:hypothetical protein